MGKEYTTNKELKPGLKKCQDCGNFGMPNRMCKYWVYDPITEWGCSHPKAQKKRKDKSE
jgi:hypothetical protein